MRIDAHLEKLRRFESVRERMNPLEDFEMWFWMTLSGGTAAINATLHHAGLTDGDQHFATQIPDVYVVPEPGGECVHRVARRKDLIHVGLPPVSADLPTEIAKAFKAMEVVERYRDPCVRGNHPIDATLVAECDAAYADVISSCRRCLNGVLQ